VNSRNTLKLWREFFCKALNVCSSIDQNLIDQIQIPTFSTTEEVRNAVNQMKLRKAPGSDEVTVDILKAGGEPVIRCLFNFFADIWENEQMAKKLSVTTLIRLSSNI